MKVEEYQKATVIILNELAKESHEIAKEKGWYATKRTFGDYIALFHSEISEAFEEYRNNKEYDEIYFEDEKPCGIPIEIADLIIRICDFVEYANIDIEKAISIKMDYNKTRSFRHGNKKS